jgi:hypothetical protein
MLGHAIKSTCRCGMMSRRRLRETGQVKSLHEVPVVLDAFYLTEESRYACSAARPPRTTDRAVTLLQIPPTS